jgi:phosphodiesterase/alkaline phosphatase D-like protein
MRVRSTDPSGNTAVSGDFTFRTGRTVVGADRTPPQIMNARAEAITQASATIQWETDEVADSFVEYGLTSSYGMSSVEKGLTTSHSMQLQGLAADKTYHFRVMSADSSGNTGMGTDLVFRTAKTPSQPDKYPPVISGLVVSGITNTRAVVLWMTDELADSAVDHGRTASYGLRASDAAFVVVHSVVLENLSPMTEYHVRARSTDVSGNGPTLSADMKFTTIATPDSSPPGITAIKVVNITKNSALITWVTDEPSSSVVDFGNDTQYGQRMSSPVFVLQHSVMLTGLKTGATYHFKVSSTDPSGNAAPPSADQSFRALKSSGNGDAGATPPWLWLFVIALVLVWGTYFGVMYQVFRIPAPRDRKSTRLNSSH